ncbi:MAG: hypothetical protein K1X94_25475 [Sandaracinaceae bacterium]|nr:hypothetical protein [Sandaracinaceae bacterium]
MSARSVAAVVLLAGAVLALTYALASLVPAPRAPRHEVAASHDAGPSHDAAGFWTTEPDRLGPDGAIVAPPEREEFACLVPRLEIPREAACERGEPYPACRWQLPAEDANDGLYTIWRNTTPEHRWARPGLVSLVLASVREYAMRWPGEHVTVGDLDAAGPRHQTHNRGVDVDLYLAHAMADRNEPGRAPIDNYHGLSRRAVRLHRARVLDFAKILARCSGGRLRIYYADREVVDTFRAWFAEEGLVSDVSSQPMQMHNDLHRFHFHMTTAEDLAVLPSE